MLSFRFILRTASLACIVAIVVLSWLPKGLEARTGIPGQIEHLGAYLITATLLRVAWPEARPSYLMSGLILMAATLELGQNWIPGRTAQTVDFLSSALGTTLGLRMASLRRHHEPQGSRRRAF